MKLSRRPRAVLFDLDGVLLDTEPLYTRAIQELLEPYGATYDWELKTRIMGTEARSGARVVIDALKLPLDVDEYLRRRRERLRALFVDAQPLPGAPEFVQQLRSLGPPMAIATSSERDLCELKWSKHAWLRAFETVICGDDPGLVRLKPAPDIYLEVARRVGVEPAACLVFEDSPAGVKAALAAGMQVVAIKAPEVDAAKVAGADWIVTGYHEVSPGDCGLG